MLLLAVIIIVGAIILFAVPAPTANAPTGGIATTSTSNGTTSSTTTAMGDLIQVTSPLPNSIISSTTIVITGKARGSYFFEASFPIEVYGQPQEGLLGNGTAHAEADWMTNDFVPFTATIHLLPTIETPGETIHILLKNDNPSGDPARQKILDIPVQFSKDIKV